MSSIAGSFGYKLGLKSVVFPLDAPADLEAKYLAIVKEMLPTAITEKVDGKKVVGAWPHRPDLEKRLAKLGIKVGQEDNFFITPKK